MAEKETNKISVLLVDDHPIVRNGVRSYLETLDDIEVIGEAGSGEEAIEFMKSNIPDVVLMDLLMEGMNGVEATKAIKQISPSTHVVVLTSHHDDSLVFPAMKAGALSYVLKIISPEELVNVIRMAAKGTATLSPEIAKKLMDELHDRKDRVISPFAELTEREYDVLELIAQGNNNSGIAAKLFITEKTVKGYVSNILHKLHLADRTQAAVFAWREGLFENRNSQGK
ncbi:MAG: response regulator [Flexilinea sp.]